MISVVTYTYNDHRLLYDQINRLLKFNKVIGEIIIVDDGSEQSVDVKRLPLTNKINLVAHESNMGPAFAKKTGLAHASKEYILSVDCDIEFDALWLFSSLEILQNGDVVLVGAKIINKNYGDSLSVALHYESVASEVNMTGCFAPGGVWLLKRRAYEVLGGIDDYSQKTHEDWFFSRKVVENGLRIVINDKSDVIQLRRLTRGACVRRDTLYHLACYRSIIENQHPSDMLSFIGKEIVDAKAIAERFLCWVLVYIKIAKFVSVFARMSDAVLTAEYQCVVSCSVLYAFRKYNNISSAIIADCCLPTSIANVGEGKSDSLVGIFNYIIELVGEEGLSVIDGSAIPVSLCEEESRSFDFHFTNPENMSAI